MKMNFRSFLNGYRIKEAQRLFSLSDNEKYTIEFVARQVGFKSRSGFYYAFKDITGVSPNFYSKSLKEQDDNTDISANSAVSTDTDEPKIDSKNDEFSISKTSFFPSLSPDNKS